MWIAIAAVGWLLFLGIATLYFAGLKLDAAESNALSAYGLALLLSDDFRTPIAERARVSAKDIAAKHASNEVPYVLMQTVTMMAKQCYHHNAPINTLDVIRSELVEI